MDYQELFDSLPGLTFLVGLSGTGKTTLAHLMLPERSTLITFHQRRPSKRLHLVSFDDAAAVRDVITERVKSGESVYVDMTSADVSGLINFFSDPLTRLRTKISIRIILVEPLLDVYNHTVLMRREYLKTNPYQGFGSKVETGGCDSVIGADTLKTYRNEAEWLPESASLLRRVDWTRITSFTATAGCPIYGDIGNETGYAHRGMWCLSFPSALHGRGGLLYNVVDILPGTIFKRHDVVLLYMLMKSFQARGSKRELTITNLDLLGDVRGVALDLPDPESLILEVDSFFEAKKVAFKGKRLMELLSPRDLRSRQPLAYPVLLWSRIINTINAGGSK